METFDWVTVRDRCSVEAVFQSIRLDIESDIKVRNAQLPAGYSLFQSEYKGDYIVVYRPTPQGQDLIRIGCTPTGLKATRDADQKVIIEATLTLNDDGECRLKTRDKELEFWQFRRRALEWLFFDSIGQIRRN